MAVGCLTQLANQLVGSSHFESMLIHSELPPTCNSPPKRRDCRKPLWFLVNPLPPIRIYNDFFGAELPTFQRLPLQTKPPRMHGLRMIQQDGHQHQGIDFRDLRLSRFFKTTTTRYITPDEQLPFVLILYIIITMYHSSIMSHTVNHYCHTPLTYVYIYTLHHSSIFFVHDHPCFFPQKKYQTLPTHPGPDPTPTSSKKFFNLETVEAPDATLALVQWYMLVLRKSNTTTWDA